MNNVNLQKKLILFLSFYPLISISTFKIEENEPVAQVEEFLNYTGNKTNVFIICNSSHFFKIKSNCKFQIIQKYKSKYSYLSYTFYRYPLTNISYDFLNSLAYDYKNSKIEESNFIMADNTSKYSYNTIIEKDNNFENLIIKIPIDAENKTEIHTFIKCYSFNNLEEIRKKIMLSIYIIIITSIIGILVFIFGVVYFCCKIFMKNNNNNPVKIKEVELQTVQQKNNKIKDNKFSNYYFLIK